MTFRKRQNILILYSLLTGFGLLWLGPLSIWCLPIRASADETLSLSLRILYPVFLLGGTPWVTKLVGTVAVGAACVLLSDHTSASKITLWTLAVLTGFVGVVAASQFTRLLAPISKGLDGPDIFAEQIGRAVRSASVLGLVCLLVWLGIGLWITARLRKAEGGHVRSDHPHPVAIMNRRVLACFVLGLVCFFASIYSQKRILGQRVNEIRFGPADAAHGGLVRSLAFFSGGERLVSASSDGSVRVWSVSTGENIAFLQTEISIREILVGPDDNSVMIAGGVEKDLSGEIQIWDFAVGSTKRFSYPRVVTAIALSPAGSHVAIALSDNPAYSSPSSIRILESESMLEITTIDGLSTIRQLSFDDDGDRLFACDSQVSSWSLTEKLLPKKFLEIKTPGPSGAYHVSADGRSILVGSPLGWLMRYEFPHETEIPESRSVFVDHYNVRDRQGSGTHPALALSPDESTLFVSHNQSVCQINAEDNQVISQWDEPALVAAMKISADGRVLAVGGQYFVRLYDLSSGAWIRELKR